MHEFGQSLIFLLKSSTVLTNFMKVFAYLYLFIAIKTNTEDKAFWRGCRC